MNFDIDKYLGVVAPLDESGIDFDDFRTRPLDDDTLRCLRYMHDVEHHTSCYLRDLLVTPAHQDPDVTTFLAMWVFEEFWHGEAIGKVLAQHDEVAGRQRIAATRTRVGRERVQTIGFMAASAMTEHIVAIAMTWGAVNEWTTQAGYLRLAERCEHPTLARLLRRIAKQEGRHIDFYASQAERRLESRTAQRLTRLALKHKWKPVGSNVMPQAETDHLIRHLFGGSAGADMAARIDRRIERLPGLGGLSLIDGVRRSAVSVATSVAPRARRVVPQFSVSA